MDKDITSGKIMYLMMGKTISLVVEKPMYLKGRHSSGTKGNFESDQKKSKVCSYIHKYRECTPLFVTMDTNCKLFLQKGQYFVATYQKTA